MSADTALKFCCAKFAEQVTDDSFQQTEGQHTWNINGCCGGGCYVVTEMRFCPFCGSELDKSLPADRIVLEGPSDTVLMTIKAGNTVLGTKYLVDTDLWLSDNYAQHLETQGVATKSTAKVEKRLKR